MSVDLINDAAEGQLEPIDEARLISLAAHVLGELRIHPAAELSILLVDRSTMSGYHRKWLGENGPTDVLSFPMDELRPPARGEDPPEGLLGDVVICPQVAAERAPTNGRTAQAEVEYLLVHGVLHLLGFDHGTPAEEAEMFQLTDRLIAAWPKAGGEEASSN